MKCGKKRCILFSGLEKLCELKLVIRLSKCDGEWPKLRLRDYMHLSHDFLYKSKESGALEHTS